MTGCKRLSGEPSSLRIYPLTLCLRVRWSQRGEEISLDFDEIEEYLNLA